MECKLVIEGKKRKRINNYCRCKSNADKTNLYIIHNNGEITEDITNRIKACWLKWRNESGVLCEL